MTIRFVGPRTLSCARCLALLLTALMPCLLFATAQEPDVLVLSGQEFFIYTNPLSPYLETHPDAIPKSDVTSSSLWRGYVARWEVKDDRLFLTDIRILHAIESPDRSSFSTEYVSVLSKVFPQQETVPAEWFTGHVIIPQGKRVSYVHMGYASTYEKYVLLRVEAGRVTKNWTADAAEFVKFRETQFELFKQTEEYRSALAEAKKEDKEGSTSDRETEEFLREYYAGRYTSLIFDRRAQ